jgi:hypothetical protein
MTRLTHTSPRAYIQLLRMSRVQVFILVEGHDVDVFFYDQAATFLFTPRGTSYRVVSCDELPGAGGGGKGYLVAFFQQLRAHGALRTGPIGFPYSTLFCLDKDIEDLSHTQKRSPHLFYTEGYSVENYLFRGGNLPAAVSAVLGVTQGQVVAALGPTQQWLVSAQQRWLEWTALCTVVKLNSWPSAGALFGVLSRINSPPRDPTDAGKLASEMATISIRSGLPLAAVQAAFDARVANLRRRISRGQVDAVFPGKWYLHLLQSYCQASFPQIGNRRFISFVDRTKDALQTSLNFGEPWAVAVRAALLQCQALA